MNWAKPKKGAAVHTGDGGSPLNGTSSPVTVEVVKEEDPSASQADSGNSQMKKEFEMMQIRFETLRAEFKAAIQKV